MLTITRLHLRVLTQSRVNWSSPGEITQVGVRNSVVILRLRGHSDLGGTFMEVLRRYAQSLRWPAASWCSCPRVTGVIAQLRATRVLDVIDADDVYTGDEWVGRTVRQAHDDAQRWIEPNRRA